jgi:hypothetical protein
MQVLCRADKATKCTKVKFAIQLLVQTVVLWALKPCGRVPTFWKRLAPQPSLCVCVCIYIYIYIYIYAYVYTYVS